MSSVSVDLRRDPVSRCFKHYLMPAITGMIIKSAYVVADIAVIGQSEGSKGLAAVNIAIPYFTFMFAVAMAIGVGGSALMAIRFGEDRHKEGLGMFQQATSLTVILMLIMTAFTLLYLPSISRLFGANDELLPLVMDYLGVLTLFAAPYGFGWVMSSFIRNDGNPKLVMFAMISSACTNVFLDWLFMFPLGMGMKGAALATGIAQLFMSGILLLHFRGTDIQLKLKFVMPKLAVVKNIISNGVPTFILESSLGVVIMVSNWVLLSLGGNLYLSAYTIALNCTWIIKMLCFGVGQAAQPVISFNHGARQNSRILETLKLAFSLVTGIGFVIGLCVLIFAEPIASAFVDQPSAELVDLSAHALRVYALAYIPMGICMTSITLYQSVAKARYSTLISLSHGLILPLLGLFMLPMLFGVEKVWFNLLSAELLTAIMCIVLLIKFYKSLQPPKEILHSEPAV